MPITLRHFQAHLSRKTRVEQVMDMVQIIADNRDSLSICGGHLGDLNNLQGCSNITDDLGTLASNLINSTQDLWNVTSDVVTIVEMLNNCSKESIFKKAACYTKVFGKVTKMVDKYFAKTIKILQTLALDSKNVIADIADCFHHKKIEQKIFNENFHKCLIEMSHSN